MLRNKYREYFGENSKAVYSASGRTEIGGNHTDHQNGRVLAAAVELEVSAAAAPVKGDHVSIYSEGYGEINIDISDLAVREEEKGRTEGLIRGVLSGLAQQGFETGGFKAYIKSDVPAGSGLSSSAAFEILIGRIQSGLYNNGSISPVELAKIGRYAENVYFGKPCGLMDQLACAFGGIVFMDFAYDECPIIEEIDFDFESCGYCLCITHTGGSHADLNDDYAAVPTEMEKVAKIFGKDKLRGITMQEVLNRVSEIREKAGDRALLRAMHFINEDAGAALEAKALKEGNIDEFLRLVKQSGNSSYKLLQNIYTGKDPGHQNLAAALAVSEEILGEDGVCRVHGGGFAGTIQAFVKKECCDKYIKAMDSMFGEGACSIRRIV